MIMDKIQSYWKYLQLNSMNSCSRIGPLELYLIIRKSSILLQMKRGYIAIRRSTRSLYEMSFHFLSSYCHSTTFLFHSVKMSTPGFSRPASTPYCSLSGISHRDITSLFCPKCGIDVGPFRTSTVVPFANSGSVSIPASAFATAFTAVLTLCLGCALDRLL